MPRCHVCERVFPEHEGYYCAECGKFTCKSAWCGDGDHCTLCLEDAIFLPEIWE